MCNAYCALHMWGLEAGLGVCSKGGNGDTSSKLLSTDKSVRLIIRLVILGFVSQFKSDVCQFRTNREAVTLSKLLLLPHPSFLSHSRKSQMKMVTACHRPPIVTFPP